MYSEHRAFNSPNNPRQVIWRYQDLAKLLNLVQKSKLFFVRADRLSDVFEGSFPQLNLDLRRQWVDEVAALEGITIEHNEKTLDGWSEGNKQRREWHYVNCWHMNDVESAAMWELYGRSEYSLAIKSSFSRLTKRQSISAK